MPANLFAIRFSHLETRDVSRRVNIRFLNVLKKYEKLLRREYERIVANWNHNVQFKSRIGFSGGYIFVDVWTNDEIFGFVEDGTNVRHTKLSRDWQSKTQPGSLRVFPGRGHAIEYNPYFLYPGIEAREFSKQIEAIYAEEFMNDIENALIEGFEAATRVYKGR